MEDTKQFVEKLHEDQQKAKRIQQRHGEGNPGSSLPGKQHSTNK